jgi:hypothetical protein
MQLRVRSLDGAELVLEVPPLTVRVQVADIKRRALVELRRLRATTSTTEAAAIEELDDGDAVDRRMASACLAFRGQLLADADDVHLFALAPTDFFVLIEESEQEEDVDEDLEDADEETKSGEHESKAKVTKRRQKARAQTHRTDQGLAEDVIMQLVEMGFDLDQAREATTVAHGELPCAIALLTGEIDASATDQSPSHSTRLQQFVRELLRRYPELAAIESLLLHEQVQTLKRIAMRHDFEALVMLKESFPAHWLAQMNENPAATALFLAVPEQFERASSFPPSVCTGSTIKPVKKAKRAHAEEVDLTRESASSGDASAITRSQDQEAIDRVRTSGRVQVIFLFDITD